MAPRTPPVPEKKPAQAAPPEQLSSRPKYGPIPEFGMIVLESRHAPDWSGPRWFDEDFNKFLFVASGRVLLHTPEKIFHLERHSLVHAVAHKLHSNVDVPGEAVVVYVIHYRAVARYHLKDFDGAWADLHACRELGLAPSPGLIRLLEAASGKHE